MQIDEQQYWSVRRNAGYFLELEWRAHLCHGVNVASALDRIITGRISMLEPGRVLPSLILEENGEICDVIQVFYSNAGYVLLSHRNVTPEIDALLADVSREPDVSITPLAQSVVGIEGPYAWRIAKEIVGPDVFGLRPLGIIECSWQGTSLLCARVGTTGEYGYRFLVPNAQLPQFIAQFSIGAQVLPCVNTATRALLAAEVRAPLFAATVHPHDDPLSVQLRYMINFRKARYRGQAGLAQKQQNYVNTCIGISIETDEQTMLQQCACNAAPVLVGQASVGVVRDLWYSPHCGRVIGYAMCDRTLTAPGVVGRIPIMRDANVRFQSTPFFRTESHTVVME